MNPENKSRLIVKIFESVILLIPFLFITTVQDSIAQIKQQTEALNGYYQLRNNKELYIQISSLDKQLLLTQLWDSNKVLFDQKTELGFTGANMPQFTLDFKKDESGAITQFTAFGKDVWDRRDDYKPPIEVVLSDQEKEKLQRDLKEKADAYMVAVNANAKDKITAYLKDNVADSLKGSITLQNVFRNTGGIDFFRELSFQPGKRTAIYLFKGKILGNFQDLAITLNENNKIVRIQEREVRITDIPLQKLKTDQELISNLKKTFSALDQADVFSGAVLVAKGDKILFEYACGEAIKSAPIKNNVNTRFNLGSMNKMFTATSIMQLVEQKKIQLNDPISKYVDTTWLPKTITDRVTIHHLLSHSSGLGDFFGEEFDRIPKGHILQSADFKPMIKKDSLAFEPGSRWSYSNSGMILLGVIIEKVTGMSYPEYVNKYIFKPAGMSGTGSFEISRAPQNIAYGYILQEDGSYKDNNDTNGIRGSAAGGGYSTVGDIHKFAQSLLSGKLVSEQSKKLLFTDHLNSQYGYGFQLQNSSDGPVIGHSGGAPGVNSVLYSIPEKGYNIIVLANYHRAAQRIADYILGIAP